MKGHVLFISKEERTFDEAWENLLRFCIQAYIPETFYTDLDNPAIAKEFDDERERFNEEWDVNKIEELHERLKKAKEENADKEQIEYLQKDIEKLEAFKNGDLSVLNDEELALKKGNLEEWIESIEDFIIRDGYGYVTKIYKIRDGKIYTTKNFHGLWDCIFEKPDCLLTDKQGNEVESCICKDIDFSELSNNVTAITFEDAGSNLHLDDDDDDFEIIFNKALNSVPPDSYIRILQYHTAI